MQITKNFTLEEMYNSETARIKKINNTPSVEIQNNLIALVKDILQPIRDRYGKPIYVNSGYRSPALNKAVGGVANSEHLTGNAVDITSANNKELWALILDMIKKKEIVVGQLIDEKKLKWVHISRPSAKHTNQILKL